MSRKINLASSSSSSSPAAAASLIAEGRKWLTLELFTSKVWSQPVGLFGPSPIGLCGRPSSSMIQTSCAAPDMLSSSSVFSFSFKRRGLYCGVLLAPISKIVKQKGGKKTVSYVSPFCLFSFITRTEPVCQLLFDREKRKEHNQPTDPESPCSLLPLAR